MVNSGQYLVLDGVNNVSDQFLTELRLLNMVNNLLSMEFIMPIASL